MGDVIRGVFPEPTEEIPDLPGFDYVILLGVKRDGDVVIISAHDDEETLYALNKAKEFILQDQDNGNED